MNASSESGEWASLISTGACSVFWAAGCPAMSIFSFLGKLPARPAKKIFPSTQEFDFEGVKGRLLSSSYAPEAGQPCHAEMLRDLETLFNAHQKNSRVEFIYDTVVYYGKLR